MSASPLDVQSLLMRERWILLSPLIIELAGDTKAGVLLSNLLTWAPVARDPHAIYKTVDEMQAETGLSKTEQKRARRILREKNLCQAELRGYRNRFHYEINFELIIRALQYRFDQLRLSELRESVHVPPEESAGYFAEDPPSLLTKKTSKKTPNLTSKKTTGRGASRADGTYVKRAGDGPKISGW